MQAALLDELGFQFSDPQDVSDVLDECDLRETVGRRPIAGVIGRFLLLGRFHYLDHQIMLCALQPLFAPGNLAYALGRTLVTDAYNLLDESAHDQFESYAGRASRIQAFKWGMPQAALFGTPVVTAIRQQGSPVTLTWIGDQTCPNLTRFTAHVSTQLISCWQEQDEQRAA